MGQSTARDSDETRDLRAELWNQWQAFEVTFEANPRVVRNVAKLLIEDGCFAEALAKAASERQDWIRDAAGLIFRLHGLIGDGLLPGIGAKHADRFQRVVATIIEPFESPPFGLGLNGTFYGSLYMQAVLPMACAERTELSSAPTLRAIVRRIGSAAVARFEALGRDAKFSAKFAENVHLEYARLANVAWGSKEADIVWTTLLVQPIRMSRQVASARPLQSNAMCRQARSTAIQIVQRLLPCCCT